MKIRLFLFTLSAALLFPPLALAAFGVSPPFIHAEHLVPGASYEQIIYLVRDDASASLPVKTVLDVPEPIKSWVSVEGGAQLIIPQGVRQFPVRVAINVPKEAALAVYHGTIDFTSVPPQSGQVSIAFGAEVSIDMTVGNDIYRNYKVLLVRFKDVEEGQPPQVDVMFENKGNIEERIDNASFELFDKFKATRLAFTQKNEGFPAIPPFSTKTFAVEFPLDFHMGLGEYWGSVNLYREQKLIGHEETIFKVVPARSTTFASLMTKLAEQKTAGYWVLGGFLVILVLGFLARKKKRGHGKS